jgi:hypothetical protein
LSRSAVIALLCNQTVACQDELLLDEGAISISRFGYSLLNLRRGALLDSRDDAGHDALCCCQKTLTMDRHDNV